MTSYVKPTAMLTTNRVQSLSVALMAAEHLRRLAGRIKERRLELELSQDELARRIGGKTTGTYVSRWERGANEPSDLDAVADALETTVADLASGPVAERKPKPVEAPDLLGTLNGPDRLTLIEAKLDCLLRWAGVDPLVVEQETDEADTLRRRRTG